MTGIRVSVPGSDFQEFLSGKLRVANFFLLFLDTKLKDVPSYIAPEISYQNGS
jgi:hypothetical protein